MHAHRIIIIIIIISSCRNAKCCDQIDAAETANNGHVLLLPIHANDDLVKK
jgi:hypothetical protein